MVPRDTNTRQSHLIHRDQKNSPNEKLHFHRVSIILYIHKISMKRHPRTKDYTVTDLSRDLHYIFVFVYGHVLIGSSNWISNNFLQTQSRTVDFFPTKVVRMLFL